MTDDDWTELDEARMWARHGYELGQRSGYWTDHGTAPEWLTGMRRGGNAIVVNTEEEPDARKVLVRVSRGGLDIGDRIVSKSLNATNDDWDFTVERAVWPAQRAGNTFTEEDIING